MVGSDGALPLPWLAAPLQRGLQTHAHALLLHGPEGVGQFELALTLAQAWLCESVRGRADILGAAAAAPFDSPAARADLRAVAGRAPSDGPDALASDASARHRPCGICASCRLIRSRSHPDLLVLVPEALREALGWVAAGSEGEEGAAEKSGKAKPSKEIKVEAVRAAVAFAQTTSARGGAKVVVLHPAERINQVASNTLLKTLEEPPGDARFLLSCGNPDALLPTIRSRCQALALQLPEAAVAAAWLHAQGVAAPAVLLAACGGQPLQALQWSQEGVDAKLWTQLPSLMQRGEAAPWLNWPVPRLVDALQKLCHDALCVAAGAAPRYFPVGAIRCRVDIGALTVWSRSLTRLARHAEHPWSAGLLVEALVAEARDVLSPRAHAGGRTPGDSVHSGA